MAPILALLGVAFYMEGMLSGVLMSGAYVMDNLSKFGVIVAEKILKIQLSIRLPSDAILWPHANGEYTVKSGYAWLMEKMDRGRASSSTGTVVNWGTIWSDHALPKFYEA
ncbi:hypothetical protein OROGR_030998 [Orobanche gracilis]